MDGVRMSPQEGGAGAGHPLQQLRAAATLAVDERGMVALCGLGSFDQDVEAVALCFNWPSFTPLDA